jgi:hypothetical protein
MQYRRIWKWTQKGKLFFVTSLITSKSSPFLDIGKIMFVNFEDGALEKQIKSKGVQARLSASATA